MHDMARIAYPFIKEMADQGPRLAAGVREKP